MKILFRKKSIFLFGILFIFSTHVFAASSKSDSALFAEMSSAFNSNAYPGVVEYAARMEKFYPRSPLMTKTLLIKGQSLFYLGRYDEAIESLTSCVDVSKNDSDIQTVANYFLGRSYFEKMEQVDCQMAFYNCLLNFKSCSEKNKIKNQVYADNAVMYAGQSFYRNFQFLNAEKYLANAVCNGKNLSQENYANSIIMLFDSYLKNENYHSLIKLYINLDPECLEENVYSKLSLDTAAAYEALGQYKAAYSLYSKVMQQEDPFLASLALQKAYNVASVHKKDVGADPGQILEKVKDNLSGYSDLLSRFWTRLALDSYNAKDFKKARQYFENASEADEEKKYAEYKGLYLSFMLYEENTAKLDEALSLLKTNFDELKINKESPLYADYENTFARFYVYKADWNNAADCAKNALDEAVNNENKKYLLEESSFWYAQTLYNLNKFEDALNVLKPVCGSAFGNIPGKQKLWYNLNLLYAKTLSKCGQDKKSQEVFELLKKSGLNKKDLTDYSISLFRNNYYEESLKSAIEANEGESYYMAALSYFNLENWSKAERYFVEYIGTGKKEKLNYANVYIGYSQYKQNRNREAYATLINFVSDNKNDLLAFKACVVASDAAVQFGDLEKACFAADCAIECALTEQQKQEAITLSADIYTDAQNFDKAISLLTQISSSNTEQGKTALYKLAQIYERKGLSEESDKTYELLTIKFPDSEIADEASYRRGELYYAAGKYKVAISRFKEYQKNYRKGKFLDASYFYIADSYAKTSQLNAAALQYKYLIETLKDSSYVYNARRNLIQLYRSQENYEEALKQANVIIDQFPELATKDGIYSERNELQRILSGEDEEYIKLLNQYKAKGGSMTKPGRITGTSLCEIMWQKEDDKENCAVLAEEIYSIQTDEENIGAEAGYAARTAVIVAEYNRSLNENSYSAQIYLECARYARMDNNVKLAQRALYGAVEAFVAAGWKEDAKKVYETMNELYADSDYTVNAYDLVEEKKVEIEPETVSEENNENNVAAEEQNVVTENLIEETEVVSENENSNEPVADFDSEDTVVEEQSPLTEETK